VLCRSQRASTRSALSRLEDGSKSALEVLFWGCVPWCVELSALSRLEDGSKSALDVLFWGCASSFVELRALSLGSAGRMDWVELESICAAGGLASTDRL